MRHIPKNFLPAAVVSVLAASMGFLIAPIESLYIQHLDHNNFVTGSIFALGSILMTVLSLWFGHLADNGHRHKLIFLGLFAAVIYPFLYANVINAFQYAGIKVFWAMAGIATGPLITAYIQEGLSNVDKKGKWFGYLYATSSIVGALAHFMGGYLGQHYGLREDYIVIGFIAIFNLIFAAIFLHPIKSIKHKKASQRMILSGFKYFLTHKPLTFYLVMNMAIDLNFTVKYFLWPLAILQVSHKVIYSGDIFATMGVVAFIVLVTSHKWADQYSPYKTLIFSVAMLAIGGLVFSLTNSVYVLWASSAVFAIGESSSGPPQGILMTDNIPGSLRGRILAIDNSIDNITYWPSLLLAGSLLTIISAQKVFLLYVLISVVSLIYGAIIYKKHLKQPLPTF